MSMQRFHLFKQVTRAPHQLQQVLYRMSVALLVGLVVLLMPVRAQADGGTPDDLIDKVGFDQRLDEQVPLNLTFVDERGAPVRLGDYFGNKPVVLMLGYLGCPNICSVVTRGMVASFNELAFNIGEQFTVISVSIDPRETPEIAAIKKADYLRDYGRPGAAGGWHFLTGTQAMIAQLAQAVGYRYAYDPRMDQFAHPAGLVVLTPRGKIARYFYGVAFSPADLRLGLVEAADHNIGTPVDQLLLRCYHYDPLTGQYSIAIMNIVRILGVATVLLLGIAVFLLARRNRRQQIGA